MTTLLAHIGFENSSDVAIETLTDVADHFLRRMSLLLKVATEQKDHGFPVRRKIAARLLVQHMHSCLHVKLLYLSGRYGESISGDRRGRSVGVARLLSGVRLEVRREYEEEGRGNDGETTEAT